MNSIKNLSLIGQATSSGGGIGDIIVSLTNNLQGQLTLALSGIAIVALIINAIYGMAMGSDDGPRAKKRFISICLWYLVGLFAVQIIGWLSSTAGTGGF